MYTPVYDEINRYKDYDVIPVSREIYADIITPITLLRKIADKYKNFYHRILPSKSYVDQSTFYWRKCAQSDFKISK